MLPSPRIRWRWIRLSAMPQRKRFGRFSVILDTCHDPETGKLSAVKVAYVRDHPALRDVLAGFPHVPRAVRSIYSGPVRLGHFMATDAWPVIAAMDAADAAWNKYSQNVGAR